MACPPAGDGSEIRRDPREGARHGGTPQLGCHHLWSAGWAVAEEAVTAVAARYARDLSDPFARQATPPWLDTRFLNAVLARR
jgi:hypothetical protein